MGKQINVTLSEDIIAQLNDKVQQTGARNIQELLRRIIGDYLNA